MVLPSRPIHWVWEGSIVSVEREYEPSLKHTHTHTHTFMPFTYTTKNSAPNRNVQKWDKIPIFFVQSGSKPLKWCTTLLPTHIHYFRMTLMNILDWIYTNQNSWMIWQSLHIWTFVLIFHSMEVKVYLFLSNIFLHIVKKLKFLFMSSIEPAFYLFLYNNIINCTILFSSSMIVLRRTTEKFKKKIRKHFFPENVCHNFNVNVCEWKGKVPKKEVRNIRESIRARWEIYFPHWTSIFPYFTIGIFFSRFVAIFLYSSYFFSSSSSGLFPLTFAQFYVPSIHAFIHCDSILLYDTLNHLDLCRY